jgi:hypothetical protein
MGNAVASVAKFVAKAVISAGGNLIPVIGGPLASYVNSKFAKGAYDVGTLPTGVELPEGAKQKLIKTPAQLKALVKQYPDEAKKAGLTVEMIDQEVKEAKEQAKAVGGMVKMKMGIPEATGFSKPKGDKFSIGNKSMKMPVKDVVSKAVGGKIDKPKKEPSPAQIAARKKFGDMARERAKKKHDK